MDKLPQVSVVLALSQLVQDALKRDLNDSPMKKVMPFLSLDKAAHKLGRGSYSCANRLIELEWGEPQVTHVSTESHHHTTITNNSVSDNPQPGIDDTGKAGAAKLGESASGLAGSAATGAGNSQQRDPNPAGFDLSAEKIEHSIINRSLAYRPLFIQGRKNKGQSAGRNNLAPNRRHPNPEMMGLLNGSRHYRRQQAIGEVGKSHDDSEPSGKPGAAPGAFQSWSIPMPVENAGAQKSARNDLASQALHPALSPGRLHEFNPVDFTAGDNPARRSASPASDTAFASDPGQISQARSANMPHRKHQRQLATGQYEFAPNVSSSFFEWPSGLPANTTHRNSRGQLPAEQYDFAVKLTESKTGMPSRLPNRKPQGPMPAERIDSSTIITDSFAEKIENLIAKKVQELATTDHSNKVTIDDVRQELKTKFRPESIVTEQMIRILMGKLQKTMREERFRMGLMS